MEYQGYKRLVSILTRPEGRVQPTGVSQCGHGARFQSSPVPKDGCNQLDPIAAGTRQWQCCFNPHPSRRTGATSAPCRGTSPRPVSILTRPEGRVQPPDMPRPPLARRLVSILTRPEGRVQQAATIAERQRKPTDYRVCFNPHPSRRTGATAVWQNLLNQNRVSILTRPEGRVQRRPQAVPHLVHQFQSSPVPKDGCNAKSSRETLDSVSVSILTRPEGRVQLLPG
jgi:hypothetical protein